MEKDPSLQPSIFPTQLLDNATSHLDTLFQTLWELKQIHPLHPNYLDLHTCLQMLTARITHFILSLSSELQEYIVLPFHPRKETPDWLHTRLSNDILQLEEECIQSIKKQLTFITISSRHKRRRLGMFRSGEGMSSTQTSNLQEEKLFQTLQSQISTHDGLVLQSLDMVKEAKQQYEKSIFQPYEVEDEDEESEEEEDDDDDEELENDQEKKELSQKTKEEWMVTHKSEKEGKTLLFEHPMDIDRDSSTRLLQMEERGVRGELNDREEKEDEEENVDDEQEDEEEEEDEENESIDEGKESELTKRQQRWTLALLPNPAQYQKQLETSIKFLHSGPFR